MDSYNLSSATLGPWRSTNGGRKERSNWSCAYLCTCNVCKAWSKDHLGSVEKQKMHKMIEADWRLLKRYLRTLAIFRCSGKNAVDRINQLQAWRFPTEQTFDSQTPLWYVSNYLYIYIIYYIYVIIFMSNICINLIYTRLYPIVYPHILLVLDPIWRVALVLEARLFLKGKRHQRHLIANERATLICLQLKVRWETVWKCGLWYIMTIQKCWKMGNESTRWPSKNVGTWGIHSPICPFLWGQTPWISGEFFPARRRCKFTWQPPYMSSKMPLQQGRTGHWVSRLGGDWLTMVDLFSQRWLTVDWPFWVKGWLLRNPQVGWTCHWRWGKFISAMFGISKATLVFSRNGCCWDCKAGLSRFQETTLALQEPPFWFVANQEQQRRCLISTGNLT